MNAHLARGPALYVAPRCRICERGTTDSVDLGGAVCGNCLRQMNADPQAKRRLILGVDQYDW